MNPETSTKTGIWCRLETEEPLGIGNVLTATIVGVRTIGSDGVGGPELPAKGTRGREIVAWRGIDGVLQLSEARCPHQFVHLASSGTVDGCELVCTAHFWRFSTSGVGTLRDSNGHREPVSTLKVFSATETDNQIWGYFPQSFVVAGD
jgi:nitrite reductase/ring-hydroxylating ferredoxin subunit